jgi:ABC-type dipeptide/oligopeptide/nickel transport system permease subunit
MKTPPSVSPATLTPGLIAATIAAIVGLFLALPAMAYEGPPTPTEYAAQYRPPALTSENDGGTWTLALLGPAAIIVFVTALGLTITVRSLRADVRRQLELDRYWQRGARSRAASGTHG